MELAILLTPPRQAVLRRLCASIHTRPDLVTVALLALGSVRDQETIPIAKRLIRQRIAVKDAAEAFLDVVSRN